MKYCSKCGTKCLDSDNHCPKCGAYLKDPKTYNKMTLEKFIQTPEYMGCVALGLTLISVGLCIGSAFARTRAATMSIIALIVAIAAVFISSNCRREMPEEMGMRSIATAAYALGIVSIVLCIVASACNGCYSAVGCIFGSSKQELDRALKCVGNNLGLSPSDMGFVIYR